ncbi:hypothetical protein EYF80_051607 [Liparis tanakae]|uniref:Uncharacterized protein n=1 Tax=Liparis tanakae TaxID=230148 RepID=A0A4Z2FBC2_9TELE|nr:hypothetical protein EYF80_051607 [Liparis tanakae]
MPSSNESIWKLIKPRGATWSSSPHRLTGAQRARPTGHRTGPVTAAVQRENQNQQHMGPLNEREPTSSSGGGLRSTAEGPVVVLQPMDSTWSHMCCSNL